MGRICDNENHVTIAKLKHNKPLTPTDLPELERFVYESDAVESRERFEQTFGSDKPLTLFIRSLVGLDRGAAKADFGQFLDASRYSSQQIRFIEMIIDQLTRNGMVEPRQLYEPPFTVIHFEGLDGAFGDGDAETIVSKLQEIWFLPQLEDSAIVFGGRYLSVEQSAQQRRFHMHVSPRFVVWVLDRTTLGSKAEADQDCDSPDTLSGFESHIRVFNCRNAAQAYQQRLQTRLDEGLCPTASGEPDFSVDCRGFIAALAAAYVETGRSF